MKVSARERKLLSLLGAVGALALFRGLWLAASPPPPPPIAGAEFSAPDRRNTRSTRGSRGAVPAPTSVVALRTDRLDAVPGDFQVGRDLFRFGPPPAPPPPPPPTAAELARQREAAAARRRELEEAAVEAAKPHPPPLTLKYLGSFGPPRSRIAVFTDAAGQNLWNARVGDVVDGKFIVDKIGLESVDLRFVGFEDVPPARLAVGG